MVIDKYKSEWTSIINYSPSTTSTPSLWDILDDVFGSSITTTRIKKRIINRCASFAPVMASSTTQDLQTWLIEMRAWGDMRKLGWERSWDALTAEYNPIENYNRHKEEKTTYNLDHPNTTSVTASVSPDNASTFYNTGKTETAGGISDDGTVEIESDDTGNVGVTTNQQMIQSELELRSVSFIETYIIRPFINEFAVAVY